MFKQLVNIQSLFTMHKKDRVNSLSFFGFIHMLFHYHHAQIIPLRFFVFSSYILCSSHRSSFKFRVAFVQAIHCLRITGSTFGKLVCAPKSSIPSLAVNRKYLVNRILLNHLFRIWNKYPLCDCFRCIEIDWFIRCVL